MTIQGPSLLVRKQFAQKFSVSANHYVDKVNSASIDVVTTASPYEEERTQNSVGLDYLHDRWMMNIGLTNSEENDYTAETFTGMPNGTPIVREFGGFNYTWNLLYQDASDNGVLDAFVMLDFVSKTEIPEPGSVALVGLVGSMLAMRRRRT